MERKKGSENKIVSTICNSHCGGACVLKVHVKNGVIRRIETDNNDEPQFRACSRGRAYRQRVYAPDRLLYPLKRVGERGSDQFERVTWDQALDTVADELKRVKEHYGPASILHFCSLGDGHALHSAAAINRLLCMFGGYTSTWGFISYEGGAFSAAATYGTSRGSAHTGDDFLNSRLILMWGWDPATTIHRCNTPWYLAQARESGAKIYCIDPRYTDSAAVLAHQWIPIRPGTDTAMMVAMAYVMIHEGLYDQKFLDRYTLGFDKFRKYVMGCLDGIVKTPRWAEPITGAPAEVIYKLAKQYATTKPAALVAGIAPGRTAYGEQYHRAAITLSAMTGNIGVHGGSAADRSWGGESWGGDLAAFMGLGTKGRLPSPKNLVWENAGVRWNALKGRSANANSAAWVNSSMLADAILKGKAGGYPADYKLLWLANTNYLNQACQVDKTVRAFKALEFLVVQEQFMTPTAKFADIVLPVCTFMERNDFSSGGTTPFFGLVKKVIEPIGESRSHLWICEKLAPRLGIAKYSDKTEEGWLQSIVDDFAEYFHIPNYSELKKKGIYKVQLDEPYVGFREQIKNPQNNPFPTPSGKIEIFSQQISEMGNPLLPPIPQYIQTWESVNDPLAGTYPLQLITTHFRRRAHSQFDNLPWLRELQPQSISINKLDAEPRGIGHGDVVRVFNDRGEVMIPARVTERIMPGVVDIPQGAWFQPNENGADIGGCANVLTKNLISPAGAFCSNTCLVQVEKA